MTPSWFLKFQTSRSKQICTLEHLDIPESVDRNTDEVDELGLMVKRWSDSSLLQTSGPPSASITLSGCSGPLNFDFSI